MELFLPEVKDMNELREVLKDNTDISKEYEVAVIAYIFDKENKIIFQKNLFFFKIHLNFMIHNRII